jgi:hypothetical protein
MRGYALIEFEILGSLDEVVNEIIKNFKEQLEEAGDEPLSATEWESVRSKINKLATTDTWKFDPNGIEELNEKTVPRSIKVNRVHLSDPLVQHVKESVPPGVIPYVFEYSAFLSYLFSSVVDDSCPHPEFPIARAAFYRGEPIHLFRDGKPFGCMKNSGGLFLYENQK